jgi:hypothetical protein
MTDIDKARKLFRDSGLAFPAIPEELATQVKELGPWLFSTRPIKLSPYNLQHYVEEVEENQVEDYAVISHSGHGANSFAIQYYVVQGSLHLFLHLSWGGVYSDARKDAARISDCFSIADRIISAAQSLGRFQAGERLMVIGSDTCGSDWWPTGEVRRGKPPTEKAPAEVLTQALEWLTTLSARESVTGGSTSDLPKGLSLPKQIRLNGSYDMELNDLFRERGIDPQQVLVLRHTPVEPKLREVLRRPAAERPDLFNAYQQTQTIRVEKAMKGAT